MLAVVDRGVLLLAGALTIAAGSAEPFGDTARNLIAVVSAIALGMQNAAARELAVPDATTTVLTMTLTGFAADLRERNVPVLIRRLLAIVAMLVGALIGAILVLRRDTTWALALAVALVTIVCAAAFAGSSRIAIMSKSASVARPASVSALIIGRTGIWKTP